jgi:ornithine cyclodeaminase
VKLTLTGWRCSFRRNKIGASFGYYSSKLLTTSGDRVGGRTMSNRLVLNESELRQVVGISDTALTAIETAFSWLAEGRADMPPIMHIQAGSRGDVDVKSAYIDGLPYFAIKIASGFYENPDRGLPAGSAMMVLLSSETGFCAALLLDNSYLTDLRTGLAGAVAAKYLAPATVDTVGVLGNGTQARYQVRCLRLVRPFRRVIVWGRSAGHVQSYVDELQENDGLEVVAASSVEEVVCKCDLLVTATASREPLVKAEWLRAGQHITAVGSDFPGKQELEVPVLRMADRLVCDRLSQCKTNGELQHLAVNGELPAGVDVVELGQLTMRARPGRQDAAEITVCDLTGTGVQDTAIANLAFTQALQRGLGTVV